MRDRLQIAVPADNPAKAGGLGDLTVPAGPGPAARGRRALSYVPGFRGRSGR
ncbi:MULTISPECIES: hypothetical protein [Streptosporangium]|uniref:Uncharacterized protein n=1 Tax=Streptosporangium brasiliense TaxID=47480 RepID=A0ABT9RFI9_9ACTN|nr:hypothetical protein [Streptosporangium brasiliense]MDP9868053.1 hypothetical protein [Streptosporangium brasiliense]